MIRSRSSLPSLTRGALLACAVAFAAAAKPPARPAKAAPLPAPVQLTSLEGITEYQLGNGLHVLLFPDDSAPRITTNITYLVGSRNERYGETGMAHLLEHLMFKGTDQHPDVPKVLNSLGARFNGTTWYDRTNYFVSFPASAENLSAALELEADRMIHSHIWKKDLWDEKEKRGEMTVVRNEMESGENEPDRITQQRTAAVAFEWHNYGKDTIGARSDVENVNIEHLQAFYRNYYQPDNAYLLVAGKFDAAKTLAEINEKLGRIPKPSRTLEPEWTVEPVQDGERSVTIRRVGGNPFLDIGYHVPQSANLDADAADLAAQILTNSPSGRLYKALVETKLASRVSDEMVTVHDPGFLQFLIELPAGGDLDKVQSIALSVIEDLKSHPLTEEEVARARAEQIKAYDLAAQHTDRLAIELSEWMAAGDWRLYFISRDRCEKITREQVQSAAESYFKQSNRTIGRYIPTEKPDRAPLAAPVDVAAMVKDYKGRPPVAQGEAFDPSPKNIESRLVRFGGEKGLNGALLPKKTKGEAVTLALDLYLGSEQTLGDLGSVPELTAAMLLRGTRSHTRQQLKDQFDQLKAQVSIDGGSADAVHVRLSTDREHLQAALALLGEVLKTPSFPADELNTLRNEEVSQLEASKSEPQAIAFTAYAVALSPYPKNHPLAARTIDETIADARRASRDELAAFHDQFYGAQHAEVAVVGDFDAAAIQAQLQSLFGGWSAPQPYARVVRKPRLNKPSSEQLEIADKANAFFVAGEEVALQDTDPDFAAFVIANRILGGGALKSRLADRIRQKEGISYGIGSQFYAQSLDRTGQWLAYAIYAPENASRLDAAFAEELARAQQGFTADELAFSKKTWQQGREVSRTQDQELIGRLAANLYTGRTMDYDAQLEAKVASLSLDEVNAAFKKYFDPARLTIYKAGTFTKKTASVDEKK